MSAAPDAGGVPKLVALVAWRSNWPIRIATIVAAARAFVAAEIDKMGDAIPNRRLELLQGRIKNSKRRVVAIAKASGQLNDRIFNAVPDDKTAPSGSSARTRQAA